jgi:uncharacterized protein YndB with AHSA1/START domain
MTDLASTDGQQQGAATMAVRQLGNERTTAYADGLEFVMERVFDAPRELVWRVFTEASRIARWWGTHGSRTEVVQQDFRVGGAWRYVSHADDRDPVPFKGRFLEIEEPSRIVYTFTVDIPPMADMEGVITASFEDLGDGRTRFVERSTFPSPEVLEEQIQVGMVRGALEQWDRLAEEIARG